MSKKYSVWLIGLVYISITCVSLTACGTKGPLYIPEQRYPQAATAKPNSATKVETNTGSDSQHNSQ